jgi:predicted ATPase
MRTVIFIWDHPKKKRREAEIKNHYHAQDTSSNLLPYVVPAIESFAVGQSLSEPSESAGWIRYTEKEIRRDKKLWRSQRIGNRKGIQGLRLV